MPYAKITQKCPKKVGNSLQILYVPNEEGTHKITASVDSQSLTYNLAVGKISVYGKNMTKVQGDNKTFTAVFKDSDGNIISNQKVLHMFSAIAPEAPEKDGYMFTGWSDSFTCIDKDKVITAIYKEDKEPRLIVNSVQATSGDKGVRVAVVLKKKKK